ncbi:MAG: 50S ribosomal protein L29 [Candidatus Angelobacter sp. Gp1-AA117]|nr:MAG: 50S ribosomal protein L29 [Candidatus Angelobacter sp. Gp1-AA117]
MDAEKIRNMTDAELQHQQGELNDQLFRLKFQLKMGQTESLKKIRGLRKDVARIKTIMREKELGVVHTAGSNGNQAAAQTAEAAPAPKKTAAKKKPARKKSSAAARKTPAKAKKSATARKTRKK